MDSLSNESKVDFQCVMKFLRTFKWIKKLPLEVKSVVAESVRLWNHYENLFRLKLSLWCLTLIQVPNSTYQNDRADDEIGL